MSVTDYAFPVHNGEYTAWGITFRDWFAGQAMSALITESAKPENGMFPDAVACWAYRMADAMLAERAKQTEQAKGQEEWL